jgi:hypothetical protein
MGTACDGYRRCTAISLAGSCLEFLGRLLDRPCSRRLPRLHQTGRLCWGRAVDRPGGGLRRRPPVHAPRCNDVQFPLFNGFARRIERGPCIAACNDCTFEHLDDVPSVPLAGLREFSALGCRWFFHSSILSSTGLFSSRLLFDSQLISVSGKLVEFCRHRSHPDCRATTLATLSK